MPPTPIQSPASYVPSRAAAYADVDGTSLLVSVGNPLPVTMTGGGGGSTTPLSGTASVSGVLGPFSPVTGRAVVLTLSGTWAGSVKVLRSTNAGVTKLPLTVAGTAWAEFTGNCCEPVWEESEAGATLYLDAALSSGTLTYRLAQ